jgi:hypothetical protein
MTSPRTKARIAGVFYLLVFVTGIPALFVFGRLIVRDPATTAANILAHESLFQLGWLSNLLATVCYIVVTGLFYEIFKPASRVVSLTAAFFSLVGCAISGVASIFQLVPLVLLKGTQFSSFAPRQLQTLAYAFFKVGGGNVSLVFFGFYCLLIGYLILNSTFVPRFVGAGMVIAGLGWLTFLWPPLSQSLAPYNLLPGIAGEGLLTLWLIAMGVNNQRWQEQMG